MRKLFARVTGSVGGSKRENESDTYSPSNSVTFTAESVGISNESQKGDSTSELIFASAQSLLAAVQEILYDSASLQENTTGFERLLTLLNEAEGDSSHAAPEDISSLDMLLINCKHPLFTQKCNEVGLATALMHALRLLRMYEIKLAKSSTSTALNTRKIPAEGVTFGASRRLCLLFSTLLSDHRSTEKIRQSLIKLLTFPLSALPERGMLILHPTYPPRLFVQKILCQYSDRRFFVNILM